MPRARRADQLRNHGADAIAQRVETRRGKTPGPRSVLPGAKRWSGRHRPRRPGHQHARLPGPLRQRFPGAGVFHRADPGTEERVREQAGYMSSKARTRGGKRMIRGQPSWRLASTTVEAFVTEVGGHLGPVT